MTIERLKEIRKDKDLKQEDVAKVLKITQVQYSRYERGINIMPVTYLVHICEILDISADYVIGLIDEPISYKKSKEKLTNS